jgi:S-adenosylmethionine synthetase
VVDAAVGKLYNAVASRLAAAIIAQVPGVSKAECYVVNQIGVPIDKPRMAHVRLRSHEEAIGGERAERNSRWHSAKLRAFPRFASPQ